MKPEAELQCKIIHYLRLHNIFCFAPMNETFMTLISATRGNHFGLYKHMESMGFEKGIPDIWIVLPGGSVKVIEVKSLSGRVSDSQKIQIARLNRVGVEVFVCRSFDEFLKWSETNL